MTKYTQQNLFLEQYLKLEGIAYDVCQAMGITLNKYYHWRDEPKFYSRLAEVDKQVQVNRLRKEESDVRRVENHLYKLASTGNNAAPIFFYLKNRAAHAWRDDMLLRNIYIQSTKINLSSIVTDVNGLNIDELIGEVKALAERVASKNTNATMPTALDSVEVEGELVE